jgi:hypothetical protein
LEGLEKHARVDPAEFLEGRIALLAQLLGLLVAFIGPTVTSRLLGEVWPKFNSTTRISTAEEVEGEEAK